MDIYSDRDHASEDRSRRSHQAQESGTADQARESGFVLRSTARPTAREIADALIRWLLTGTRG